MSFNATSIISALGNSAGQWGSSIMSKVFPQLLGNAVASFLVWLAAFGGLAFIVFGVFMYFAGHHFTKPAGLVFIGIGIIAIIPGILILIGV